MENAPVITLNSRSRSPGADFKDYERYVNWSNEVYLHLRMKDSPNLEAAQYNIVKENPEYGARAFLNHYRNIHDYEAHMERPEPNIITQEHAIWLEKGILDQVWSSIYRLVRSFRNNPAYTSNNQDTRIENAPVMHLEGYRMSTDEQEKYLKWLNDFGFTVFMPLLMKLPGIVGYDFYVNTGLKAVKTEGWEYPKYLSIVYFEHIEAFESFAKSQELEGFQKTIRSVIARRLGYIWYVQYQLSKRLRR